MVLFDLDVSWMDRSNGFEEILKGVILEGCDGWLEVKGRVIVGFKEGKWEDEVDYRVIFILGVSVWVEKIKVFIVLWCYGVGVYGVCSF